MVDRGRLGPCTMTMSGLAARSRGGGRMRLEGPKRVEGCIKKRTRRFRHTHRRERGKRKHQPSPTAVPTTISAIRISEVRRGITAQAHTTSTLTIGSSPRGPSSNLASRRRRNATVAEARGACEVARAVPGKISEVVPRRASERRMMRPHVRESWHSTTPRHADSREPTATHQHTPDEHTPTPTLGDQGGTSADRVHEDYTAQC